jgi:polysaccharide pyruvyl transferase WcaK-like protein
MRIATILGPVCVGLDISSDRFTPASRLDQGRPPFWIEHSPRNVGDWFINKGILRVLDYEELYVIQPHADQRAFDFVNENCDAVILKGGNYLHRNGLLRAAVGLDVFSKFTIPVIMFGSGVQAGPGERPELDREDIDVLKAIHDSCESSAVRGYASAELLAEHGIDNVVVTGCPTLMWQRKPELRLRTPTRDHAAFTFRDGLFSADPAMNRNQFVAIERLRQLSRQVTVALQGEEIVLQDLYMAERWGVESGDQLKPTDVPDLFHHRRVPFDAPALRAEVHRRYANRASAETIEWLSRSTFFSWDITDYLDLYKTIDLVAGCRFHGNLLALANGVPAYYLTYDRRTEELVDLLQLPNQRLDQLDPDFDPFEADWSGTERMYKELRSRMISFLEGNGLAHRLGSVDAEGPSGQDE